jgi:hypothetical protein
MADLTAKEKRAFERLLGMGSGYVLNFSNRTFEEFVLDTTGREIYNPKYDYGSGSKANRLRGFWNEEPNPVVAKLLGAMLDYDIREGACQESDPQLAACRRTVVRLQQGGPVPEIEVVLLPAGSGQEFDALTEQVREAIETNRLGAGLDRLHTYVVRYVRSLCAERGIVASPDKPLPSLFGEYVKQLRAGGHIESAMTERILRSSIGTLQAFNDVRNNQSFAHDNQILNYEESLLIFNNITSLVRFLRAIEARIRGRQAMKQPEPEPVADDIPF